MKVSIITVCLNCAETIEDTIKSVLGQGYENTEYIFIDGGSTDGTLEIITKYKDRLSRVISESDNGIYDAMNKGIKLVTGDIVGFLNSGDFYADNTVITKMVEFMQTNNLDAAYADLVYVDREDTDKIVRFWKAGKYKKGAFGRAWVPPHPTFFCCKDIFDRYGYFAEGFQVAADFELMLRFIEKNQVKIDYLPKVIVKMRTGGKSNTLAGIIRGNREIIKAFQINGLRLPLSYFICKPMTKTSQFFQRAKKLR